MKQQRKALALAAALVISIAKYCRRRAADTRPNQDSDTGCDAGVARTHMDQSSVVERGNVDRLGAT